MQQENDEIRLKDIILKLVFFKNLLLKNWLVILAFVLLFSLLGVSYSLSKKTTYTADLTFVVDEQQEGHNPLSSMAGGIASQFGFNIGGGSRGTFSQSNIEEIITSKRVVQAAILQTVTIDKKEDLLIHHYFDFNGIYEEWKKNGVSFIDFSIGSSVFSFQHDSLMGIVYNDLVENYITTSLGDENSIFLISCVSENEQFSKLLTESLATTLENYYIKFQTAKSESTLNLLSFRADSVLNELKIAEYQYATHKDANFGVQRAEGLLEEIRLKRNVEILNVMYAEIIKNLEISKFTLINNKPLLNIIDRPVLPLEINELSPVLAFILFGVLGGFGISFFLIVRQLIRDELA